MSPKTRFHSLLEQRVVEAIAEATRSISGGQCVDYPSYREMTGYIRGLQGALTLCDEINEEYNK